MPSVGELDDSARRLVEDPHARTSRRTRSASSTRGRRASRPSTSTAIWPSCGRRRSTMFMSAMTLMRLTSDGPIDPGSDVHLVQRAVGADADAHAVGHRLDVHVGRAVAHRLLEDDVHDLDDRRVLVDDGLHERFLRLRGLALLEARLEHAQRVAELGRRRVATVERLLEVAVYGELDPHQRAQQLDELRVEVLGERIRDRDLDASSVAMGRQRAQAPGVLLGEQRDDFGIDLGAAEVDDGHPELLGEHIGENALAESIRARRGCCPGACPSSTAARARRRVASSVTRPRPTRSSPSGRPLGTRTISSSTSGSAPVSTSRPVSTPAVASASTATAVSGGGAGTRRRGDGQRRDRERGGADAGPGGAGSGAAGAGSRRGHRRRGDRRRRAPAPKSAAPGTNRRRPEGRSHRARSVSPSVACSVRVIGRTSVSRFAARSLRRDHRSVASE